MHQRVAFTGTGQYIVVLEKSQGILVVGKKFAQNKTASPVR